MSKVRPKIADYPFTTLVPNLGVVQAGSARYTIADVPGLIEGASEGKGLGHDFLRHIERCSVIAHVLDTATLESDRPARDSYIHDHALESDKFPKATFVLSAPIRLSGELRPGTDVNASATGSLTLHGVTKSITLDLDARWNGDDGSADQAADDGR